MNCAWTHLFLHRHSKILDDPSAVFSKVGGGDRKCWECKPLDRKAETQVQGWVFHQQMPQAWIGYSTSQVPFAHL